MLGDNIRKYMQEINMTQYRLAKLAKISQPYLNEIVNNKVSNPSVHVVQRISKALGVSITKLLDKAS